MELLLNLVWLTLALACFGAFAWNLDFACAEQKRFGKSLLAIACMVFLLFPIVSASDDLHPTQALLEDATKRIQASGGPIHSSHSGPVASGGGLSALLTALLLLCLSGLQRFRPATQVLRPLQGNRAPLPGRAPPTIF